MSTEDQRTLQLPDEADQPRLTLRTGLQAPAVGQMMGTSDWGGTFKVSAGPEVSADIQRAFIQHIVYRHWDFQRPLAVGDRAVYLYKLDDHCLFGWLYSEPGTTPTPHFICYHLSEPLNATQLENVLLWLQAGPAAPSLSSGELRVPDLWTYRPERPGVSVPESLQQKSLHQLERGESLDLFVLASASAAIPAPVLPALPEETAAVPAGDALPTAKERTRVPWGLLLGVLVGGAGLLGLTTLLLVPEPGTPVADGSTELPARPAISQALPTRPAATAGVEAGAAARSPVHPDMATIPGLPPGTFFDTIEATWGPASVRRGYWPNTEAIMYEFAPERITVGYLIDRDSKRVRQSEVAFDQSVKPTVIRQTVSSMLGAKRDPAVMQGLKHVYQRQIRRYAFQTGDRKGVIERNIQDRIYIGIWEADLH